MNLYYTQFIQIICLLERMLKMTIAQAKQFREFYNQYLKNNEILINFIHSHIYIKGYSAIQTQDISKVDFRIIGSIEDYIRVAESNQNKVGLPEEVVLEMDEEIIIQAVEVVRQSLHERGPGAEGGGDLSGSPRKFMLHQSNACLKLE